VGPIDRWNVVKALRVAHFSFADGGGGAAQAVYRLHTALRDQGIDGQLHVLRRQTEDPTVRTMAARMDQWAAPRIDMAAVTLGGYRPRAFWSPGWYGASDPMKVPGVAEADIIALYWIPRGFLGVREVEKLLETGKPVVWRLSDMWPFTGGCHYAGSCDRYLSHCGACPELGSARERDLSWRMHETKQRRWEKGNLTIVAPSQWIARCAADSSLFRARTVRVIATGVDTGKFQRLPKEAARAALGLPLDQPLVLYGAISAVTDARKGATAVTRAMDALYASGGDKLPGLLIYGADVAPPGLPPSMPTHVLGVLKGEAALAMAYSAADVFVAPAKEENLANSVLEAMACELPVVAFNAGGMSDAVSDETGALLPQGDIDGLAAALKRILSDPMLARSMGVRARHRVLNDFCLQKQASRYADLYVEMAG
jgi:glycosyltransferase involved in cell wall biosynthesis